MHRAAVSPRVIEGDIVNVNGSYLNVAVRRPPPLQAVAEVFIQDVSTGVVIVEYLRGRGWGGWGGGGKGIRQEVNYCSCFSDFLLLSGIGISDIMCMKYNTV